MATRTGARLSIVMLMLAGGGCGAPPETPATTGEAAPASTKEALTLPSPGVLRAIANALAQSKLVSKEDLAFHHAPVHFQDVNRSGAHSLDGKADWLLRFDYDGDWVGTNNWESLGRGDVDLRGAVYWAVTESESYWYISYMFYHARDWAEYCGGEHEHDGEGILMFVRKNGTPWGQVEGILTTTHEWLTMFVNPNAGVSITKTDDGHRWGGSFMTESGRVATWQEAEGHALLACGYSADADTCQTLDTTCYDVTEDGIHYVPVSPASAADVPSYTNPHGWSTSRYGLRHINDLWLRRYSRDMWFRPGAFPTTFSGDKGSECGNQWFSSCDWPSDSNPTDGAGAIWATGGSPWEWANDPEALIRKYFSARGGKRYFRNDFFQLGDIATGCYDMTSTHPGPLGPLDQFCSNDAVSCYIAVISHDFTCSTLWDAVCVSRVETDCAFPLK